MESQCKEAWKPGDGYTEGYYEHYKDGSFKSAMAILPIVLKRVTARRAVDIGCGSGQWIEAARGLGIEAFGTDPNAKQNAHIYPYDAAKGDRLQPILAGGGGFDLAICVEVAEHIDEDRADLLINQLCDLAPIVLFGAAIPGQGGENHINEQWPDYWAEKFAEHGYIGIDCIRRQVWNNDEVEAWYAQNTILYVHPERATAIATQVLRDELTAANGNPARLIHPRMWMGLHRWVADRLEKSSPAEAQTPPEMAGLHIYLGMPNSGSNEPLMPNTITKACNAKVMSSLDTKMSSALTHNFNELWCAALNARATHGVTHFAMLHSDIRCLQPEWLDRMIEILLREKCDLLSVVIPIKDGRGLTSTAMDTDPWRPRRFTMTETYQMPATFGNEDILKSAKLCEYPIGPILFNTGLWICRLDQPWAEKVCFDIRNRISKTPDGKFYSDFAPEDWEFARWCHKNGINYKVTREIEAVHIGPAAFSNTAPWGSEQIDERNIRHLNRIVE